MVRSVQHVTPRGGGFDFRHVVKVRYLHSSHGPDQQLQRRQRVYRQLGVQQALVPVQMNNSET